ncbi:fumarase, class I, homodimeric [Azotobacter beijerinckii]|uniref:Fumarate hydratase class I n=1 Tax=Azotobacter beijerinckii TaxID=170623 RepID=A0A1H6YVJ5_9GAMM|nr:fumarate hydratase [Azotobacter beijerinckii]SEJ40825.1 fumarase, class I, homodimeric [Azotobacter beijerinckii]
MEYKKPFPLGKKNITYRKLTSDYVSVDSFQGREILKIDPEGMRLLTKEAFKEISHKVRPSHLKQVRDILDDPEASGNDRFVALQMLKNASMAVGGVLPMCQDTGTAIVYGKRGKHVWVDGDEEAYISHGVYDAFTTLNLRYSQISPVNLYEEVNTRNNLPAQIDLYSVEGNEYEFLFMAKGGGSANKTYLFQETKALLNHDSLMAFLRENLKKIGTAACPPYHLAVVIGGTSAESTLKTVKLATARYLDDLPTQGGEFGQAFRDVEAEKEIFELTKEFGIGCQFDGKYFCHDVRVIRLPRHGASCPVGIGVSCAADRQAVAKITKDGIFIEQLEDDPASYLPETADEELSGNATPINLNVPMRQVLEQLSALKVSSRVSLNGTIIVARDIAHAKLKERLDQGECLPQYFKDHPVFYAGPSKIPEGYAIGSLGPTTAARMDPYVDVFQAAGASMVMIGKGNRGPAVAEACKKHGGFHLGSIGGISASLAQHSVKKIECVEYPELGMEAIWRIEVEDFPAFVVVDDKGNDFFNPKKDEIVKFG